MQERIHTWGELVRVLAGRNTPAIMTEADIVFVIRVLYSSALASKQVGIESRYSVMRVGGFRASN